MIGRSWAERLLEKGLTALDVAGAGQSQVSLRVGSEELTRFASNRIHQNVAEDDAWLSMTALLGRRRGHASTNRLDRDGIAAAAVRAVEVARCSPEDSEQEPLQRWPAAPEVPGAFDAAVNRMTPLARARTAAKATKRAAGKGAEASGKVATARWELALASSVGTVQYCSGSMFSAAATAMIDGAAGSEEWTGSSAAPFKTELRRFGAEALRTALRGRKPRPVEPGERTVILAPRAAAELVEFLAYLGFASQAHVENRSCLSGRMGQKVVGENVTLRDDGLQAAAQPVPFDMEGVPRRRLTLIERGVARELPHSTATARSMKAEPTGHSLGVGSRYGGMPQHLVLEPGSASLEEMIASTEEGLYVSRFWYTNVADPARAVITGMTRDGLFRIRKGKLGKAVRNMRFTESVLDALSRVEAVGSELVAVGGDWGGGVTRVPALKIAAFRFTGATEF